MRNLSSPPGWTAALVAALFLLSAASVAVAEEKESAEPPASKPDKKPKQHYTIVVQQVGKIGCAVGIGPVQTEDLCPPAGLGQPSHLFVKAPEGTTALLLELEWTPSGTLGAKTLRLSLDKSPAKAVKPEAQGKSPVRLAFDPVDDWVTQGGFASAVHVTTDSSSGVVWGQIFTLYTTIFVGDGIPEGYSAIEK